MKSQLSPLYCEVIGITPVLMYLHWLPIKKRIKIPLFTFKALNGLALKYVSDMIQPLTHTQSLQSSSKPLLRVPRSNSATYGDRGFSMAGPVLWNSVPDHIHNSDSVDVFKRNIFKRPTSISLKKHLM